MIVESVVIGLTAITVASLHFTKWYIKYDNGDDKKISDDKLAFENKVRIFEEKKRILERDRQEWLKGFNHPGASKDDRRLYTRKIAEIDAKLFELTESLK